ncbi:MAG: hypothetical protein KF838_06050 [Phycisphaeraceae bacterium]|nr:MAG: hypothetical protein KF838_06050 [Phycisphaeraceae bacterium]
MESITQALSSLASDLAARRDEIDPPAERFSTHPERCWYFERGLGHEGDDEPLPPLRPALDACLATLSDNSFQRLAAGIDAAHLQAVTASLREHETRLRNRFDAAVDAIESCRLAAISEANKLVLQWLGVRSRRRRTYLFTAESLRVALDPDGPIGGTPQRRRALAKAIESGGRVSRYQTSIGPPKRPRSAKEVASRYWVALTDADREIAGIRAQLSADVKAVVDYLNSAAALVDASQWIRSEDAARRSGIAADTILKRSKREEWPTRGAGRMRCYRLSDLENAWPGKNFRTDTTPGMRKQKLCPDNSGHMRKGQRTG